MRSVIFKILIIVVLLTSCCFSPLCAQQLENWSSIKKRLEMAKSESGQREIGKELGYLYMSGKLDSIGLSSQGLQYLTGAGESSSLGKFNDGMTRLGGILILLQLAYDLSTDKSGFETTMNLVKGSGFLAAGMSNIPFLNAAVWSAQVFKTAGDMFAEAVYTGDDAIWWNIYEEYFDAGPGKLDASGWVALFSGKSTDKYVAHMDSFFTMEGKLFVQDRRSAWQKAGKKVPVVADPEDGPVKKHAEAFRIRYYKNKLHANMAKWAVAAAERQVQEEIAKLQVLLAEMAKTGVVVVRVIDAVDHRPVRSAFVEISLNDGKKQDERYGKTDEDGLFKAKEIAPWAEGTLNIQTPGYLYRSDDDLAKFISTADKPVTVDFEIDPAGSKLEVLVVDGDSGKGVSGATISAKMFMRGEAATANTGSDGNSTMSFPRLGDYSFTITAPGYQKLEQTVTVNQVSGKSTGKEIFRLSREGKEVVLSVEVRDKASKKPIAGVNVAAKSSSGSANGVTAKNGTLTLKLSAFDKQSVEISLSREGYQSQNLRRQISGNSLKCVAELTPDTGGLAVTVRDKSSNEALPGVKVLAGTSGISGATGADGSLILPVKTSGKVSIICSLEGFKTKKTDFNISPDKMALTVLLEPEVALLKVKVGNKVTQEPLAKVKVKAIVGGVERTGETDAYGSLKLEIPAGKKVKVALSKAGFKAITVEKEIKERQATVGGTLQPDAGSLIEVTVKDKSTGKPIQGADIKAGGSSGKSDKNGSVSFPVIPGETVNLSASAKGYQTRSDKGKAPPTGQTQKVGWYLEPQRKNEPEEPTSTVVSGKNPYEFNFKAELYGNRVYGEKVNGSISISTREKKLKRPGDPNYLHGIYTVSISFSGHYNNAGNALPFKGSFNGDVESESAPLGAYWRCGTKEMWFNDVQRGGSVSVTRRPDGRVFGSLSINKPGIHSFYFGEQ